MKKYVIYGLGISGIAAANFLSTNNQDVIATDDNESVLQNAKNKYSHLKFAKNNEIHFDHNTVVIFAPGIPLYFPKSHKILEISKKTKAKVICDIEAFYNFNNNKNFIGITGTNGKSTTTALSAFLFENYNINYQYGGNIGKACFELDQKSDCYILETSSYQLDLIDKSHFKIAALLGITKDHLDRHGNLSNYIAAKKRIFQNQKAGDFALIDIDNENSRQVFLELQNNPDFVANLVPISTKNIQETGISLIDGILTNNIESAKFQSKLKSQFLHGKHNDQNMAFAFAIIYCYLLQNNKNRDQNLIINNIKNFKGLSHRLELLGQIDNINFINDSKATNAQSTEQALKAYDNIFWIVGGVAKEGGITTLKNYFNKIHKAYLIGESSEEFAKILNENSVNFEKCQNLTTAFKKSYNDAKNVGLSRKNILLSPACASFDQWQNFEQRGNYFCKLFNDLSQK